MKPKLTHRLWAKVLAWFLLAFSLIGALLSGLGIDLLWNMEVYTLPMQQIKEESFKGLFISAGDDLLVYILQDRPDLADAYAEQKNAFYRITDAEGNLLWQSPGLGDADFENFESDYTYDLRYSYETFTYGDGWTEEHVVYQGEIVYRSSRYLNDSPSSVAVPPEAEGPLYQVSGKLVNIGAHDALYWMDAGIDLLYSLRYAIYTILALCVICCVCCFVFLLCGAGHRAGVESIVPGPFTKIPFDLFTLLLGTVFLFGSYLGEEVGYILSGVSRAVFYCMLVVAGVLLAASWCVSFATRVKLGQWWRNTLLWWLCRLCWKLVSGLAGWLWKVVRGIPLVWKTLLGFAVLCFVELLFLIWVHRDTDVLLFCFFLEKVLLLPVLLWISLTLRRLQKGGQTLAAGDLEHQVDTKGMFWDFKRHGEDLNRIGDGITKAVAERTKSERLKTELITNVSHDIKTPLTSIINYVDLLQRDHSPAEEAEYLEVLSRQSRRLKKLTEDLVEVSKASTGNLEVHPSRQSAGELLRQVLGEYSERMEAAGLTPVLSLPEAELPILADGALMWRVLDNLCSNVCKYAQPGTRFYVDAAPEGEQVLLSFKNISRERLNISADELTERFVRGDNARTGEGSGLGLSIAESLVQLQGGVFTLSVDGDLFKVELRMQRG